LNAGVFALDHSAPHWDLWAQWLAGACRRCCTLLTDQQVLNVISYLGGIFERMELLPAWCNWTCHFGFPLWDPDRRLLVENYMPRHPIGIVHLTVREKNRYHIINSTRGDDVCCHMLFPAAIRDDLGKNSSMEPIASSLPTAEIASRFEQAVAHCQRSEWDDAHRCLLDVLALDAEHEHAYHLLGMIAIQHRHHEEALKWIETAIAINPADPRFHANRGLVLNALGRYREAIQSYQAAIEFGPNTIESYLQLSSLQQQHGHPELARETLRKAQLIDPTHPDVCRALTSA
jgi:tetratricopeptide (TPR) repeat protein